MSPAALREQRRPERYHGCYYLKSQDQTPQRGELLDLGITGQPDSEAEAGMEGR